MPYKLRDCSSLSYLRARRVCVSLQSEFSSRGGDDGDDDVIIVKIDERPCCCHDDDVNALSSSSSSSADFTIHCSGAWLTLGPRVVGSVPNLQVINQVDVDELLSFVERYLQAGTGGIIRAKRCGLTVVGISGSSMQTLARLVSDRFRHLRITCGYDNDKLRVDYPRATGHQIVEAVVRAYAGGGDTGQDVQRVEVSRAAYECRTVRHWGWNVYVDACRTISVVTRHDAEHKNTSNAECR